MWPLHIGISQQKGDKSFEIIVSIFHMIEFNYLSASCEYNILLQILTCSLSLMLKILTKSKCWKKLDSGSKQFYGVAMIDFDKNTFGAS